ncbi:hypothetical protein OG875_22665 [Streptomyces sp. NBC_01498]|uniref:hypothetical protein n=1 Tax=Streptomyces sp. NBC_01498 TaxID=2975870 RepID=UPI002E7AF694|nr:hypothetical protein [Streptomyces sp. NBC_01498]WTL27121.1 hypothetical protein OG875_22665 [Streptomyces sp. NBC_01498]
MTFGSLFNPIGMARRVFLPSRPDRVRDPVVKRIQVVRSVVGLVVVVWMMLSYGVAANADEVVDDRLGQAQAAFVLLAASCPIVVIGFVAAARPPNRRMLLRRVVKPLGALIVVIACVVLPRMATGLVEGREIHADPAGLLTFVIYLWSLVWFVPFAMYGVVQSIVHIFRTADIHETVPPVMAILLVWELAVFDLVRGAYEGVPFSVRLAFTLGAPLSVTAVALWEFRRLRTRHGITLRGVLLR